MKTTFCTRRLYHSLALALAGWLESQAAPPRFDPPTVTAGAITLNLRGDSGKTYRIETSSNLVDWAEIATGVAANGLFSATHDGPALRSWLYYRGREVAAFVPYPTVEAQANTNDTAVTLITPELGGLLQVLASDGTAFTLEVPTNAVFTPTFARMTLLTNVSGIPATSGFLSAVRLEPEGLWLASPTFLTVNYPTNLPTPRMASFSFDNDGSQFHLSPDLVGSNRVRLLVNQFRSYGSGVFTEAELEALLATGPAPRAKASARRGGIQLHATLEECYPDEEAEAKALHEELTEAIRPLQEEIAGELALERQRQLLGVPEEEVGSPVMLDVLAKGANWYAQNILPRIPNAEQKCLVAKELLLWILGWERQLQLLGAGGEDPGPFDSGGLACKAMVRCQEQILECCRTRGADRRLVIDLLGLERQRQLLGMTDGACGSFNPDDLEACLPQWFGELRITESYRTNTSVISGSYSSRSSEVKNFELAAYVDSAEEVIVEPVPIFGIPGVTNITFKLSGLAQGTHTIASLAQDLPICPREQSVMRASPRPHDPVGGFRDLIQRTSSVSNLVTLELRATLTDSTGGIFAPKNSLNFISDPLEAAWKGGTKSTRPKYSGSVCTEVTTETPATGTDTYGGVFVLAEENEFQHSPREISFSETKFENGEKREIQVKLKRRN